MFLPDAFEDITHHRVLDEMVFCLGEKQGMIVNGDCSLWYDRVGGFMSVWKRRKEILYGEGSACKVSQNDPTLDCEAKGSNSYGS